MEYMKKTMENEIKEKEEASAKSRRNSTGREELKQSQGLYRTIADFEIQQQLGKGGFGTCFKAIDRKANRVCVVKKVPFSTVEDVYNISNEIQVIQIEIFTYF